MNNSASALAALLLGTFLAIAVFSFAGMTYGTDGRMQGDCPFSNMGTSLCPQGVLPGAVHHINAYQSFLNAPVNPLLTAAIIASLVVIFGIIALSFLPLLYRPTAFIPYGSTPFTSQDRKIKRWLSLFEYSPTAN